MSDDVSCAFLHAATGEVFPAIDPVAWCLENAGGPPLAAARERLMQCDRHADADRIVNVVLRRCGLTLVAVRPGRVVASYWAEAPDLRPYFKSRCLARPDVPVALVHRKSGRVAAVPGDDFLYGERLGSGFPWGDYRGRWERRQDRQPDDGAASPWCRSSYSWDGVAEGRVPWAALKSAWRREPPAPCASTSPGIRPKVRPHDGCPGSSRLRLSLARPLCSRRRPGDRRGHL